MEALQLLEIAGAVIAGAFAGVFGCHWHLSKTIAQLEDRLERSEQARNGAIERSANAREQIAQLNRAITELRRAHSTVSAAVETRQQRTARAEAALRDASAGDPAAMRVASVSPQAFADTQTMDRP